MKNFWRRNAEERFILSALGICAVGLIPFAYIRFSRGELLVGSIDLFGALSCLVLGTYVFISHRVGIANTLLAVIAMVGMTLIVAIDGVEDIHFLYPVTVVVYFLVPPAIALGLCLLVILALFPILGSDVSHFQFLKIILSIGACTAFTYVFASIRNKQRDQLLNLSTLDALTGAGNRRALDLRLAQIVESQKRKHQPSSLIMLDLDNFKRVNDEQGHMVGDQVLKRISQTIASRIRVTDSLYRYGGDEFVVLVAGADSQTSAGLAEDLRSRVEAIEAMEGTDVSISLGVATHELNESSNAWLARADAALLKSKQGGRNQVSNVAA